MNKRALLNQVSDNYHMQLAILEIIPEDFNELDFISGNTVYINKAKDFDVFLDQLQYFIDLEYKLQRYYISCDNLAILYEIENQDIQLVFFCDDLHHALHRLTEGGCNIVENTELSMVTKSVQCVLEK